MPVKTMHSWTKEDQTLAYFNTLHGISGLVITCEEEIAKYVISTTTKSFNMNCSNFRYILDLEGSQLEHASELQFDVAAEYSGKSYREMVDICNQIIIDSDYNALKSQENLKQCRKKSIAFKKESDERLQQELVRHRMYGKKLVKVSIN